MKTLLKVLFLLAVINGARVACQVAGVFPNGYTTNKGAITNSFSLSGANYTNEVPKGFTWKPTKPVQTLIVESTNLILVLNSNVMQKLISSGEVCRVSGHQMRGAFNGQMIFSRCSLCGLVNNPPEVYGK